MTKRGPKSKKNNEAENSDAPPSIIKLSQIDGEKFGELVKPRELKGKRAKLWFEVIRRAQDAAIPLRPTDGDLISLHVEAVFQFRLLVKRLYKQGNDELSAADLKRLKTFESIFHTAAEALGFSPAARAKLKIEKKKSTATAEDLYFRKPKLKKTADGPGPFAS